MAKKQTFTSKLGKDKKKFKVVKYIQTLLSEKTGHIKFLSRMIRMEEDENIDQALKREEEESSNVLAFGEQPEEGRRTCRRSSRKRKLKNLKKNSS